MVEQINQRVCGGIRERTTRRIPFYRIFHAFNGIKVVKKIAVV